MIFNKRKDRQADDWTKYYPFYEVDRKEKENTDI